MNMKVKRYQ